ncbi:hypothetical protein D3C87_1864900 [compost metagenome]
MATIAAAIRCPMVMSGKSSGASPTMVRTWAGLTNSQNRLAPNGNSVASVTAATDKPLNSSAMRGATLMAGSLPRAVSIVVLMPVLRFSIRSL